MGGAEISLLALSQYPSHEYILITFESGELNARFKDFGLTEFSLSVPDSLVHLSKNRLFSIQLLKLIQNYIFSLYAVKRIIREEGVEVVCCNTIKSALFGFMLKPFVNIKIIWYVRDDLSRNNFPRFAVHALKYVAKRMDSVVTNSLWTSRQNQIRNSTVIYPALQKHDCGFKYTRGDSKRIQLISIGRISRWKGQHIAIEALAQLPTNYNLSIIGDSLFGEEDYANELRKLVNKLGLDSRVDFIGHVGVICTYFQDADLFLHTSVSPEPFGRVIIEAMSHGVPVIASHGGGPTEIIEDGFSGFLVTPNDPNALAKKISDLALKPEYVDFVASQGFIRAQDFQESNISKIWDKFIENIFK
jgi:glycosyltransferase involved in cell wall biosynthesis